MIRNYFKTTFRNLTRNRIYSFINISGLSLGLACAMLIMLYVKDEVSYDKFHQNADNIYRVNRKIKRQEGNIDNSGYTGIFQGPKFKSGIPEIKGFVRLQPSMIDIKTGTDIQSQSVFYADSNFFTTFSFPLIEGNAANVLTDPHTVVITAEMAKKYFGNTNAVGKTLLFKDDGQFLPYTVTGVARNCPENSTIKFQMILPLRFSKEDEGKNDNWFNFFLSTFIVLQPKANANSVDAKMQKVFEADAGEAIKMIKEKYGIKELGISYYLQPMLSIHLSQEVPAADQGFFNVSNPVFSYILSGIALFILIIACINFVNLTVAQSLKRAKEIGVRKVIGSSRKQLIWQFMGESFILCLLAFLFAIALVQVSLPLFNQLSNKALALSYLFDAKLVSSYAGLFLITSVLAGFYPALVLSNYNPVQTLYNRFTLGGKSYLQKSLVVLQFSLASFLIIATLIIFSQFNFLTTQKLGYNDSNLVTVEKYSMSHQEALQFEAALKANPNIAGVALKNNGFEGNTVKVNTNNTYINITIETVDTNYIPMLGIPLVQGRNFSTDYPADSSHSLLVNEAFVREAGWKNPIGQSVRSFEAGEDYQVIGVVKDYHYKAMTQKIEPQIFTMRPQNDYGMAYIKIRPRTETASLKHIESVFRQMFPYSAYAYSFKDEENRMQYQAEAKWKQIILFGAILTIFISCIGLFGLSVLSAEKRTKEIGIRKVLGASVSGVVAILSRDFLKLVMIALLIAIPSAWMAASKWLQNYPYRISLTWWMFGAAGLLVIGIALFTISFQAIKAALSNPVKSLRTE